MIEPSRRHGHFDPRFAIQRAAAYSPKATGPVGIDKLPGGLDWVAFAGLVPGRRRHDFEVLKAYEAYKNGSYEPARHGEPELVLAGAG
jgi:hypothetical protein